MQKGDCTESKRGSAGMGVRQERVMGVNMIKKKGIIFRDEKNLQMSSDKTLLPFCQYPKDIKVYTKS